MRTFVVTGTGRSGTGYMAQVLRRCGLSCGHETIIAPWSTPPFDFRGYDGDSSWFAVPHLRSLPDDTVVIHVVREPRPVIESWVHLGVFDRFVPEGSWPLHLAKRALRQEPRRHPYASRDFIRRFAPQVFDHRGASDRAARYWVDWNRMVEELADDRPYRRLRLSDVSVDHVREIVELVGASTDRVEGALAATPIDVNTRGNARAVCAVALERSLQDSVRDLAGEYGLEFDA